MFKSGFLSMSSDFIKKIISGKYKSWCSNYNFFPCRNISEKRYIVEQIQNMLLNGRIILIMLDERVVSLSDIQINEYIIIVDVNISKNIFKVVFKDSYREYVRLVQCDIIFEAFLLKEGEELFFPFNSIWKLYDSI